jgi:hypothetical protein
VNCSLIFPQNASVQLFHPIVLNDYILCAILNLADLDGGFSLISSSLAQIGFLVIIFKLGGGQSQIALFGGQLHFDAIFLKKIFTNLSSSE